MTATQQDRAIIAHEAVSIQIGHFVQLVIRDRVDLADVCPQCSSRDIQSYYDAAIEPDSAYYERCRACDWTNHPGYPDEKEVDSALDWNLRASTGGPAHTPRCPDWLHVLSDRANAGRLASRNEFLKVFLCSIRIEREAGVNQRPPVQLVGPLTLTMRRTRSLEARLPLCIFARSPV